MKGNRLFALAAAVLLSVTACGGGATPSPSSPASQPATSTPTQSAEATSAPSPTGTTGTLTVWLMNGSLNDNSVVQLNTDFQMAHPGWKVNYQVQQWNGIVDKLTTHAQQARIRVDRHFD